jgi:uncharacterized repeat protein (TIGR01451 family)
MEGLLRRLAAPAAALLVILVFATPAMGASAAPGFTLDSLAMPTNFAAADTNAYRVTVVNAGDAPTNGSPVAITDMLPAGVKAQSIHFSTFTSQFYEGFELPAFLCDVAAVKCTFPGTLEPEQTLKMVIEVSVEGEPRELENKAAVTGGGAAEAYIEQRNAISPSPASFGPANFDFHISGLDGARDTQAGDHPYELRTTIGLNNAVRAPGPQGTTEDTSVEDVKDIVVDLPVGFVGSTLAAPRCSLIQLSAGCPPETIIGHLETLPITGGQINSPIYNIEPERGYPAEFGYIDALFTTHVFYTRVVPTSAGYVLQVTNPDVPAINLTHIVATFYGDPAQRQKELGLSGGAFPAIPFFTNPTDCTGEPLTATIYMDSWQNPGTYNTNGTPNFSDGKWVSSTSRSPRVSGCDSLRFPAELRAQPTTHEADKPSGLEVKLKVPQRETMGATATPTLKKILTTLPEGLTVDPSAGDGLAACSEAQIGWLGGSHLNFSPDPPQCPQASKIGSLELETPLVPHKFEGEMFLAKQNENPFGATLAAYVVVNDPITGVLIKIAGEFIANPSTGRLQAVFDENPNLPFSDLKLHFFGGPRAELATPENCGTYATSMELFPYSFPDSGPATIPSDSFTIDEACPGGFAPFFTASSLNVQAGAYTPLAVTFQRSDTDQELAGLTVTLPQGLLAKVAGIPLCTDTQIHAAEEGTGGCPEASQVGIVKAGAGPGPNPLFVPGKAYLTGPYNGGPYGLAVVVPAVAGPFDFGTVVVRQSIRIDPRTARVTDVSDPFPVIIDGIPLRLRRVDIALDRPQFTFNPTSCEPETFAGSISGSPLGAPRNLNGIVGYAAQSGASSPFTTPFQVTDCAGLEFSPHFSASTKGKTSRLGGASLTVKLSYPHTPWGTEANIGRVKVSLPKQLPSRLKTLQKACTASQFNARRPRHCPHPRATSSTARPRLLRLKRRASLPEPDHGPAGRQRHRPARRRHVHQPQGDHQQHVQHDPRCVVQQLPDHAAGGSVLRSGSQPAGPRQRQLLRPETKDANRTPRPERHGHPPNHKDHSHRLQKGEASQTRKPAKISEPMSA